MASTAAPPERPGRVYEPDLEPKAGDPTWGVVDLHPRQGAWTREEFLALESNRSVELVDGFLDVLPVPRMSHQEIADWLVAKLKDRLGRRAACTAPFPVGTIRENYREPDAVATTDPGGLPEDSCEHATFVVEVVSEKKRDRRRDYVTKRSEYAAAGIQEYWIVDPSDLVVLQLVLDGDVYREAGRFAAGDVVRSEAVPGFEVSVDELFEAVPR